jgi:hypothetical protein
MADAKEPRSGQVILGGFPWLARMLDKARLEAAGTIDIFDLDFPCPMDQRLLAQLNLDAKTFQQIAVENQDDAAVLKALQSKGVPVSSSN